MDCLLNPELDSAAFVRRKTEHLALAMDPAQQARGLSGLDGLRLLHDALPELDFDDVDLAAPLFGRPAPTPFYVAGMTAGHPDAAALNRRLARACQRRGWALGVGSQRRQLHAGADAVDAWQRLREAAPGVALIGNLGLSQLVGTPLARVEHLVTSLGAAGLAVHLNPLQECLQPEGTPQFRGGLAALRELCQALPCPVVLKETGCGFGPRTLARLQGMPGLRLAALDVSGLGGTHWGRIEGARAAAVDGDAPQAAAAHTFAGWGVPTAEATELAARALPQLELWASGGVRSGLDAAKLIALGAQRVGYAQPALAAALQGDEALDRWMAQQEYELRVALFCTGCSSPAALRQGRWITRAA